MRIIAVKALREFWEKHADAEQPLLSWYTDVKNAKWEKPTDITETYANARIIPNDRVVFKIRGNRYRLVVAIHYGSGIVFVRFIGTHAEYDKIDASTI